ncbi:dynamin family protein [Streptomyces sp. BK340]|uniref:dynamin family protein n=1 Tax=Streptomyces sp. BK340 TaxID=2572903 RepID=UPI0011A3343E|nr:dynamin family protein [Streptomyces sp. BK340]TVZ94937.1 dynamin family protein [Streptomyces sp. BK340]
MTRTRSTARPAVALPPALARELAQHHGDACHRRFTTELERVRTVLAAPGTTVVFGGHFSAGKSSLLNLLIGRPLLPVDDFPETGVACVIRKGSADRVTVVRAGRRTEMPCTTDAIAEAVSLVAADGDYRREVLESCRVVIELADCPVPDRVRWVDSPGINDTDAMTTRAAEAAAHADLLVWVVNSRQPISTSEEEFLRAHRERHGPDSVLLLVNVFLTDDTPEQWQRFLATRADHHRARLQHALDGALPTGLVFVSARAAAADPGHFGGPEARALLDGISHADPAVATARRARAAALLRPLVDEAAFRIREQRSLLEQERAGNDLLRADLATAGELFRSQMERAVDDCARQWEIRARACGEQIANQLTTGPVQRDGSYGRLLTGHLQEASAELAAELARTLDRSATTTGHAALTETETRQLAELLRPPAVTVEVPGRLAGRLPELRTNSLGRTVSGRIGSMMPSLSVKALRTIDQVVNAAADSVERAKEAAESAVPDRERTRANIMAAAAVAARHAKERRSRILQLLGGACRPLTPPPSDSDSGPLTVLGALHRHLTDCLDSCGGNP